MPTPACRPTLRRLLAPLGAMTALALAAGVLFGYQLMDQDARQAASADSATATSRPAAGVGAATIGSPSTSGRAPSSGAPTASDDYAFLLLQPDHHTPIHWNPCRAVGYRVATNGLVPASEIAQVRAAFDVAGAALGGAGFSYRGTTTLTPDSVGDSARAGVDVVFAFALPGTGTHGSALLTGWEAGRAGFAAWGPPQADGRVVEAPTHGSVVIDAAKWKEMNRHDRTLLYLHEIGHIAGLDHPKSGRQVMSSGAYDLPARYQPGDLAGLARLGRQAGCTP